MRPLALAPLALGALALIGCDTSRHDGAPPLPALAGPWNGTLLLSPSHPALPDGACEGEPVTEVALAFELELRWGGEAGTEGPLAGATTLELGTGERVCSAVRARVTGAEYDPPRLRLAFEGGLVLEGEVTPWEGHEGLHLEGALTLGDGAAVAFQVLQGSAGFFFGSPFGPWEGGS